MNSIFALLENVGFLLSAAMGFILGIIAVQLLELASVGSGAMAAILGAVVLLVFFLMWLSDRLLGSGITFFARKVNTEEEMKAIEREDRREKKASRLSFAIGFVVAFMVTRVVEVEQVMELF